MPSVRASRVTLALLAASVVVLALNVRLYYPFIADDALISLRYSARLLSGEGLSWTAGPPVEGYSNLLWVLLVAAAGLGGVDLILAARVLGCLCSAVVLGALITSGMRPGRVADDWLPTTVGLLFVSLSASIAVWAIGGLEQPLVGALLAVSVPLMYWALADDGNTRAHQRHLLGLSVVLGLLAITRPDGPIFAAAAAATFVLAGPGTWRERLSGSFVILRFPVLMYGGQLVWRYAYYGELVPNTALVKLTPTAVRGAAGIDYVWSGLQALSPFSFLAIVAMIGLFMVRRHRSRALYLLTLSAGWLTYVVVIGGDIFPAYRHLVPAIVIFAFALIEMFRFAGTYLVGRTWLTAVVAGFTLVQFVPFAQRQHAHGESQRAIAERWEWQCQKLGGFLKTAFSAQQPLVAVTAAGCLPYWSELPSLDMLGLNDYYLPRHPPPDLGSGVLGHELGDGAYVMDRRPDLIVFHIGNGPMYRFGLEMAGTREFQERYVPVATRVEGLDFVPLIYVDRYSPTLGISRSSSDITVPGFLFRSAGSLSYLNRSGTFVTSLTGDRPLGVTFTAEEGSDWRIEVVGSPAGLATARLDFTHGLAAITLRTSEPNYVEIESVILRRPAPGARSSLAHR